VCITSYPSFDFYHSCSLGTDKTNAIHFFISQILTPSRLLSFSSMEMTFLSGFLENLRQISCLKNITRGVVESGLKHPLLRG